MKGYLELLENLKTLEAERAKIGSEGDVLFDCWIAQSKPGGTARTNATHWQLRSRKAQFDGRKSKYLKAFEVGQYEAAIARGKQLKELKRQSETLQKRIIKVEAMIAADAAI
ncbi:hypothetical protein H6F93_07395 [Leptolyngbya sp. FACHB-671]|uniref:hypothetical protein n=1 Tax=Leptolyngbya sp. FACHB-671 TaxID=2692812 RepID=UPI0016863974|nr:hypothetical protein [Leptolyngbya sp. FACHB-671]MBD2067354.1 hypothetical protein [Leptolyngbya sp. FACHB-671]